MLFIVVNIINIFIGFFNKLILFFIISKDIVSLFIFFLEFVCGRVNLLVKIIYGLYFLIDFIIFFIYNFFIELFFNNGFEVIFIVFF